MAKIHDLLAHYGESHQNPINKAIHWLCVPAIMFSLFGLLYSAPFLTPKTVWANWAVVFVAISLLYYVRLSIPLFIAMVGVSLAMIFGLHNLASTVGGGMGMTEASLGIFVGAWVVQFIGHKIEGKKPSFLEDVQYLLVGPLWLLHFIFKKLGLPLGGR